MNISGKYLLILLFLLLPVFLAACSESDKSYESGLKNYREGHYQEAVHDYRLAISQGGESAELYADLALSLIRLKETDEALKNMNIALGKDPGSPVIQKKIGLFYRDLGDTETALKYLGPLVPKEGEELSPDDLDTMGLTAGLLVRKGAYEEAVPLYERLINQEYHVLEHDILIGEAYLGMHQVYAACLYFDLASEKAETKPQHILRIRKALLAAGERREALRYFKKGLALAEESGSSMSPGEYLLAAGEEEEAAEYLSDPHSVNAGLCRAMTLMNSGEYEEAEMALESLLRENPDSMLISNQYMILKARKGDYSSAFQMLSHIEASDDEKMIREARFNEVMIYEMMEEYGEAFKKAAEFRTFYPQDSSLDREYAFLRRASE